MRLLFLDIDGVLNGHEKLPGSVYCGIRPDCMARLNRVLLATDASVMLSTAWRYQIINGATTVRGFEFMLYSHGLVTRPNGAPWLIGHTPPDEVIISRGQQIVASAYSLAPRPVRWAVVDDLDLEPQLGSAPFTQIRTDGKVGMTDADADELIKLLI